MSLVENPIAPLEILRERTMGFFFHSWKRIQEMISPLGAKAKSQTVAVELGQSHLLLVGVERKGQKPEICRFRLEPRPQTTEATSERLKTIFKEEGLEPRGVHTALKSSGMVIRTLTFPQMEKTELASMLQYEVEKYIPFKVNEVYFDFEVLRENISARDSKKMEMLLVAVKQEEIRELLAIFQMAGIEISCVDVGAFAFANFLEFLSPELKTLPTGFLDLGVDTSTFGIILRGKPIFIRDISFGSGEILKFLKRKLGLERDVVLALQENPSQRSPEYKAVVEQALSGLLNELRLSLGYYLDHISGAEPLQILYLAGRGFRLIPDLDYLEGEMKTPARRPDLFSQFRIASHLDPSLIQNNQDLLPPALGLCLR